MSAPSKDRWSDGGDPAKAARLVWMWVVFALAMWGTAGLVWLAWWVAQVGNYQNNYRGFNADDGFPWIFVLLCVVAGVCCLPVALVQRARARYLKRGSKGR